MPIAKQKIRLILSFSVLISLALAGGCKGFFVNPTLTTITVNPATPTVQQGTTLQMIATGTYNDGSTQTLTKNLFWSTSDSTIATVSTTGLLSGVSVGTATITASSANITGTTTATISVAGLTSITITPTTSSLSPNTQTQFTATGTLQGGGTVNLTNSAQWTSSNTAVATVISGLVTTLQPSTPTPVTISASSGGVQGSITFTVQ
jgi:trimeric autotransporter adhesin